MSENGANGGKILSGKHSQFWSLIEFVVIALLCNLMYYCMTIGNYIIESVVIIIIILNSWLHIMRPYICNHIDIASIIYWYVYR